MQLRPRFGSRMHAPLDGIFQRLVCPRQVRAVEKNPQKIAFRRPWLLDSGFKRAKTVTTETQYQIRASPLLRRSLQAESLIHLACRRS